MFQKILVALDIHDRKVFDHALAMAKATHAHLMLLHVLAIDAEDEPDITSYAFGVGYSPEYNTEIFSQYQKRWQEREKEGVDMLRSLIQEATDAGVTAEFSQNPGSPGRTICSLAKSWDADLIMMGRRGFSGLKELVLGSASNYVLHHAHCSVLVVQLTES